MPLIRSMSNTTEKMPMLSISYTHAVCTVDIRCISYLLYFQFQRGYNNNLWTYKIQQLSSSPVWTRFHIFTVMAYDTICYLFYLFFFNISMYIHRPYSVWDRSLTHHLDNPIIQTSFSLILVFSSVIQCSVHWNESK